MPPLAALIVLDEEPRPRVAGLEWVSYQVRRAVAAGAAHVVVLAPRVGAAEVAAVDRAQREGVSAAVVRTPADVADRIHPDEAVLVVSGSAPLPAASLDSLKDAAKPTLLCLPVESDEAYELIDRNGRWTGLARLDGALVRRTAAAPEREGDWNFASMLLRAAVAERATRVVVRLEEANDAMHGSRPTEGAFDRFVALPAMKAVERTLVSHMPVVATAALIGALLLALLAVAAAATVDFGWVVLPALLALVAVRLAELARAAVFESGRIGTLALRAVDALVLGTLPMATLAARDGTAVALAASLIGVRVLLARLPKRAPLPPWFADTGSAIVVAGLGALFGPTGFVVGLTVAAVHAFVSLGWAQNRLSGTLTPFD